MRVVEPHCKMVRCSNFLLNIKGSQPRKWGGILDSLNSEIFDGDEYRWILVMNFYTSCFIFLILDGVKTDGFRCLTEGPRDVRGVKSSDPPIATIIKNSGNIMIRLHWHMSGTTSNRQLWPSSPYKMTRHWSAVRPINLESQNTSDMNKYVVEE